MSTETLENNSLIINRRNGPMPWEHSLDVYLSDLFSLLCPHSANLQPLFLHKDDNTSDCYYLRSVYDLQTLYSCELDPFIVNMLSHKRYGGRGARTTGFYNPEEIPLTTVRTMSGDTDTDDEGSPRHTSSTHLLERHSKWRWHRLESLLLIVRIRLESLLGQHHLNYYCQ